MCSLCSFCEDCGRIISICTTCIINRFEGNAILAESSIEDDSCDCDYWDAVEEDTEGNVGRVIQQVATNMIEDALNDAQELQTYNIYLEGSKDT